MPKIIAKCQVIGSSAIGFTVSFPKESLSFFGTTCRRCIWIFIGRQTSQDAQGAQRNLHVSLQRRRGHIAKYQFGVLVATHQQHLSHLVPSTMSQFALDFRHSLLPVCKRNLYFQFVYRRNKRGHGVRLQEVCEAYSKEMSSSSYLRMQQRT